LWQLFTVSIAAQIGVLPLSLFYFHQFPGLFFIANMLIIPFLGFILITGIVVIILSLFSILPSFIAVFYIYVLEIMNAIITWVSSIEIFIIRNISVSLSIMLGVYGVVFFLLKWLEKRTNFRLQVVLVVLIIVQSIAIFEKFHIQNTQEFIVFNSYTNSCYGVRNGKSITVNSVHSTSVLMAYVVGSGITQIKKAPFKNLAVFKKHTILVVDSLGIYNYQSIKPTIVLLQQSPKINLERLLNQLKPQFIVADATNYSAYIKKWETTCKKNKTPFYYTQQKGAFILRE
jgi:competence protein ComEC